MTAQDRKEVLSHLAEDILRYDLHTREVAARLEMLPIYVTYAKNEKFWDKISKDAWDKFEKWHMSRTPLNKYGEYKPEKPAVEIKTEQPTAPVTALDEILAETKKVSEKVDGISKAFTERINGFDTRLSDLEKSHEVLSDDVEDIKRNLPAVPEQRPLHQVVIWQRVIQKS